MIKIFQKGSKVNFVDTNNRLVGYDTDDDCCSHGGWFIQPAIKNEWDYEEEIPKAPTGAPDLSAYVFDETFFKIVMLDEFSAAVFKLVAKEKPDLYLHLFNVHNGYYSKGFEASFGDTKEGYV